MPGSGLQDGTFLGVRFQVSGEETHKLKPEH